jgi:hypothetical protein
LENHEFYDKIAEDVKKVLIQFVSEAGHGKSSSLRTIIQYCQTKHPDLKFVIFDVSQAWFHCAPVAYRQLVTRERIAQGKISNEYDTVYEMGSLSEVERRMFVGQVLKQHYRQRYQAKLDEKLDQYPTVIFVFEEANVYFGSYALRRNDEYTQVFQDFVSVGRNYKMRGFLVATAEQGEIAPSLRRRSRRIYGRLESQGDINRIKKKDKELAHYLSTEIPRYHFVYYADKAYGPVRVPDLVTHEPEDFERIREEPERQGDKFDLGWWVRFLLPTIIFLLFIAYFTQN